MRIRDVALHTVNRQVAGERSATAIFHHIAHHFGTGRFANQTIIQAFAAFHQRFNDSHRAIFGAGFFIGRDQECQTVFVVWMLGDETFGGHHHRSQRAFHVSRTATKQHAVANRRFKWRIDPAVSIACRDDVRMSGKSESFTLATPCPKVLGVAKIHPLNGKADRAQTFNH
ncbi:hypothetical protein D3C78_670300 [compost metagenome]